jgi:hypothetical protein
VATLLKRACLLLRVKLFAQAKVQKLLGKVVLCSGEWALITQVEIFLVKLAGLAVTLLEAVKVFKLRRAQKNHIEQGLECVAQQIEVNSVVS